MPKLYVSANIPSAVMYTISSAAGAPIPQLAFPAREGCSSELQLPASSSALITVLPVYEDTLRAFLPRTVELQVNASGEALLLTVPAPDAALLNWGDLRFELLITLSRVQTFACEPPASLQRIAFPGFNAANRSVELFRDSGIRLTVYEDGRERSFLLCSGTSASMRVLDTGRERLLIVIARDENSLDPAQRETLIAVDSRFNIIAKLTAERCTIENGYLSAITRLGTALGHEKRIRHEFRAGGLFAHAAEIGFFSRPRTPPGDEHSTALAFMQSLLLGIEKDAMPLLSEELRGELSFAELTEFFGTADECRSAPWRTEAVEIGLVRDGGVTPFLFEFENGLISNIIQPE